MTVVAHELRGFRPVGGMGTATTYLALALARMGHSVEILLGLNDPEAMDPYWRSAYERAGVVIRATPTTAEHVEPWQFEHEHSVQLGLREKPADVVIAHDFGSPAYSALRLREAGLAFEGTLFVIFCHGPRRYIMDLAPTPHIPDLRNLLAVTVHEQAAIELADVVVSPSAYLLDWMRSAGWRLPERHFVIPHFTQSSATGEVAVKRIRREPREQLDRLAFFGRLDEWKGIAVFAAALNALEPHLLERVEVHFIGKTTSSWPRERIEALLSEQTRRAVRSVVFETELDRHSALAHLKERGTLVVMPSLQENSPSVIYECLEHEIPFIASNVGGVPELVAPDDRDRVLFDPTPTSVEAALQRVLADGCVPAPARPAFTADAPYGRWADVVAAEPAAPRRDAALPPIDVIVVRRTDSDAAERCAAALERQRYPKFGVTISDGTSVEAARADGIHATSAPFVVFLDEQDVPDESLLRTLVDAQRATGADIVTCGLRLPADSGGDTLHFFTGEDQGLAVLSNTYGTVGLFRRQILDDLRHAWPAEDPDWPLLARLSGAGARVVSIPVPLVTRPTRPGTVETNPSDALLVAHELERALPGPLRATARLAAGLAAASAPPSRSRSVPFSRRVLRRVSRGAR